MQMVLILQKELLKSERALCKGSSNLVVILKE